MENSVDPDQFQKPTDLDLHCLQGQDISGFSRTRVNISNTLFHTFFFFFAYFFMHLFKNTW